MSALERREGYLTIRNDGTLIVIVHTQLRRPGGPPAAPQIVLAPGAEEQVFIGEDRLLLIEEVPNKEPS